jgi:DUF4097 and DUF4098 domain-containing protein YvlB
VLNKSPKMLRLMRMVRSTPFRVVLFLAAPLSLLAVGPAHVDKTFDTTPDPQISLTNLRGQVVIRGWDKSQVHAQCTTASPRVEVESEAMPPTGRAERIHLSTQVLDPLLSGNEETADCTLDVPAEASLEIRNRQGSVQVERLQGQHASIESADARIAASDVTGHLTARSLGGDIEIVRPSGRVEANSITGNLTFREPTSKNLRGNTNSGHILYQGDFEPAGEYILSTYSGDIEVVVPSSASFELDAKTVKGKVDNAFRLQPKRRAPSPLGSASSLLGTHNTGNAMVELTSFSGHVRVRPQN